MAKKSLVVYGPQCTGKTRHAETLRRHYQLDRTVDDWNGENFQDEGVLYLTNLHREDLAVHIRHRRAFSIGTAAIHAGIEL